MSSLSSGPIGREIRIFDTLPSTNAYALNELSKTSPKEGSVIFAWFQTQGRGQIGRSWHSEAGKNCCFSTILFPRIRAKDHFSLNIAFSLGICDSLNKYLPVEVRLKWPNDLYCQGRKLGGILIQNTLQGEMITSTVAGAGINVNQKTFPADLPNPGSIYLLTGLEIDPLELLTEYLAPGLNLRYKALLQGSFHSLREDYNAMLFGIGETFRFTRRPGDVQFEAKILGIDDTGQLVVDGEDGVQKFGTGMLSLDPNSIR